MYLRPDESHGERRRETGTGIGTVHGMRTGTRNCIRSTACNMALLRTWLVWGFSSYMSERRPLTIAPFLLPAQTEQAKATEDKIASELKALKSTLDNIQSARPFDQLTTTDMINARPEIRKTVEEMVKKGKWTVPGYEEKFGSEYAELHANDTNCNRWLIRAFPRPRRPLRSLSSHGVAAAALPTTLHRSPSPLCNEAHTVIVVEDTCRIKLESLAPRGEDLSVCVGPNRGCRVCKTTKASIGLEGNELVDFIGF